MLPVACDKRLVITKEIGCVHGDMLLPVLYPCYSVTVCISLVLQCATWFVGKAPFSETTTAIKMKLLHILRSIILTQHNTCRAFYTTDKSQPVSPFQLVTLFSSIEMSIACSAWLMLFSVVTWFKDHGICKSCINYSIAYPKQQNKRYCSQYMIAIIVFKPSLNPFLYLMP